MKKFSVIFALIGFSLSGYYATWQISLMERGFTLQQLGTLLAVSTAISMLFDVPAGIFSDRVGHKVCVLIGIAIYAIGFAISSLGTSPYYLVCTVLAISLGGALVDGALESWCADVQKSATNKVTNSNFMSLDQSQRFGIILGAIMVPGIVSLIGNPQLKSWLIYALISFSILIYGFTIPSGRQNQVNLNIQKPSILILKGHFKTSGLIMLLISGFIFGISDGAVQLSFWPKVKDLGLESPFFLGLIQAGMSLARMIGIQFWKKTKSVESNHLPGLTLILSSIFFGLFAATNLPYLCLAFWYFRILAFSAFFSSQHGFIQKAYGSSGWRSTIASAVSTLIQIGTIVMTSLVGLFGNRFSLSPSHIAFIGTVFCFIAGCSYLKVSRIKNLTASF